MKQLYVALMKEDYWWEKLTVDEQEDYLEKHPKSKLVPTNLALGHGMPLAEYARSKDDPEITEDEIYAEFAASDVQEMKDKIKATVAVPMTHKDPKYVNPDGSYTNERKKLHTQIIASILNDRAIKRATPEPGTKPKLIILGGRGGSGKSAFTHDEERGIEPKVKEFDSRKAIVLDADEIKKQLVPPYDGSNAFTVHEESSYIFDQVLETAKTMGLNIVSDATLKSDKMGPIIQSFLDHNYEAEGHYMFLPRQEAAKRACGRYLSKGPGQRGRLVPPAVVLGNTHNEANFDQIKPLFSKWSCYDNNQPKGQPPKLIDHSSLYQNSSNQTMKQHTQNKSMSSSNLDNQNDYWENDPFLTRTPEREEQVKAELFTTMLKLRVSPKKIDEQLRKEYSDFLMKLRKNRK